MGPYVAAVDGADGSSVGSDLAEWRDADALLVIAARNVLPLVVELVEAAQRVVVVDDRIDWPMASRQEIAERASRFRAALAPFLARRVEGE
jgi:hypothetical protein